MEGVFDRRETWRQLVILLVKLKMQMIFLTGTLPPSFIKLYYQLLNRPDINIFRLPSDRPNISLHLVPAYKPPTRSYHHQDILLRLITDLNDHISTELKPTARPGRILVFFPDTALVEGFAKAHGFLWYHSKEGTQLLLQDVLQAWEDGPCNVLVASTSMAQGVDIEDVHYVIVMDMHFGLSALAQMMGRAGRDGYPSATYFIGHESMLNEKDVGIFSPPPRCHRLIMMTFLDGEHYAYTCAGAPHKVLACGVCNPQSKTHQIGLEAASCVKEASERVEEVCRKSRLAKEKSAALPQPVARLTSKPLIITRNASPGPSKHPNALTSQQSTESVGSAGYWGAEGPELSQDTLQALAEIEKVS